ncbi:MAG: 1-deoxy-D-xylulose-5-phosphate reductoisomerase [Burkholderiales bacterium]|jgi:1-deoxy-D-xylulose-5-phosphate reductoisomerase|nr:1-deoxy-D-xylulose-5-phosphate reductoisomerase [Burkholderiales bacterium]
MKQGVTILGATGSIGASSLDVIARHPDRFEVFALTANANVKSLVELCRRFRPTVAVIADPALGSALRAALRAADLPTEARAGAAALAEVAADARAGIVIAAIVGAAGLLPTFAAARAGKRLLLANKEAIVCAGALLMDAVRMGGAELLPVDSEHNAIHQCLAGAADRASSVRRLVLTASGGPFRTRQDMRGITPNEAVAHPNWVMGRKISVDSATLMNKGLEVIEASWLFGFAPEKIDVVIHPQSVIHSMVEFGDGSVVAQLGTPDMRTPIAYCLGYPERVESGSSRLDFLALNALTFEAPDRTRFPCLQLAYDVLARGAAASIALNAANEIAVEAFLGGRLSFDAIAPVIETTLARASMLPPGDVNDVVELDRAARALARSICAQRAGVR